MLLAGCSGRAASDMSAAGEPGLNVARAALQGGSPQVALQVAGNVLARNPGSEAALVVQGDALTALGRTDEAGASYSSALQRNSASVGAEIGLGRIRLASDPAAAEALFLEVLQHEPRNTTALNDLGVARDLQRRHADAQVAYRQALGIDPQLSAAQVNLALSMAMAGASGDAVRMLRPIASDPTASRKLRHDFAAVLTMAGDRGQAERILSSDLSPNDVQQALDAYAAARTGDAPTLLTESPKEPARPTVAAVQRETVSAPAVAATPTPSPAPAPAAGVRVQFAAVPTEAAAKADWRRLQGQMPDLLGGRAPEFSRVERDGNSFWRVRTSGFNDSREAEAFCRQVRKAGGACVVGGV